ncbi:MAG TPA: pantoate--beta-alanine ligase [Nitrospirota bacterium]|nr:pantoate--beta-alanine ligase [Nitrospirota bacterium]
MQIITSISEMQTLAESLRREGRSIGFVPTMGFLHEGHLSLMRRARQECETVVVSIFVNPTQFGPHEDFERYPRDEKGDREKCESAGVDILFMPSATEMYPEKPSVIVAVEGIADILEGAARPGHFRGVATVVTKLFHIVKPHTAYFGQKDYQQSAVIRRMVKGLDLDVKIAVLPTVREQDGLALSSRNSYLTSEERRAAAVIYRALTSAEKLINAGVQEPDKLKNKMRAVLREEPGITIDYIEVADCESLVPCEVVKEKIVILIAVRLGRARLIDNLLVLC